MAGKYCLTPNERHGTRTLIQEVEAKRTEKHPGTKRQVLVACDCGREDVIQLSKFVNDEALKCPACVSADVTIGQVFGDRTIISATVIDNNTIATTRCKCGLIADVRYSSLKAGSAVRCNSCENQRRLNEKYGGTDPYEHLRPLNKHPLNSVYKGIRRRIFSTSCLEYHHYGGRGLGMYEPWVKDRGAFIVWVLDNLGLPPTPEHTIDRIENDYGYFPTQPNGEPQLRWATKAEQNENRRQYQAERWGWWKVGKHEGSLFYVCKKWGINDSSVKNWTKATATRGALTLKQALNKVLKQKHGRSPRVIELKPAAALL